MFHRLALTVDKIINNYLDRLSGFSWVFAFEADSLSFKVKEQLWIWGFNLQAYNL